MTIEKQYMDCCETKRILIIALAKAGDYIEAISGNKKILKQIDDALEYERGSNENKSSQLGNS